MAIAPPTARPPEGRPIAAPAAVTARAVSHHEAVTEDLGAYMLDLGARARAASKSLAGAPTEAKNVALVAIADSIADQAQDIQSANHRDLDAGRSSGLAPPLLDRLELTDARIRSMAEGLRQIAALPDPVGEISEMRMRPSGLQVGRMRVPLGVIGIIYESRPNVTADAAGLCLKSGNRDHPARRLRGAGVEPRHCRVHSRRAHGGGTRPRRGPGGGDERSRRGRHARRHGHLRGRHRSKGRQGAHRASQPRGPGPGDQAPGRQLPRLHRRPRRPGHGHRGGDQREDLPLRDLRCDGDAARRAHHRSPGAPGAGRAARRGRSGDPWLRGDTSAGGRLGPGQ